MRKIKCIVLTIVSFLLFSCGERKPNAKRQYKYQVGDVVYLKPDSTKATIMRKSDIDSYDYIVKYYSVDDERYSEDLVKEFEIFGKLK